MKRRQVMILATATALTSAAPHPAHADATILTLNDLSSGTTTGFSDADLAALPQQSFDTGTIWTDAVRTFAGPSLHAILAAAGTEPARLRIHAINEYSVEFPADKITRTTPILANRVDGKRFSVREKGPLWVMFPFDQNPEFQSEEIFALSVWQVNRIDILAD
ncbi:hypothetical protein ACSSV4_000561 [Roseovarius sp. MBR-154]|jgi:hypothetical protein